jgi:two-component system response regulator VanR
MENKQVSNKLKELSILFAEDDKNIRDNIVVSLELLFKNVYQASDGFEAYTQYINNKPDIILTDIAMPGKDGLSFISKVRENNISIPIVILTAQNSEKVIIEAANKQIDGFIVKPINLNKLLEKMEVCIKKIEKLETKSNIIHLNDGLVYDMTNYELLHNNITVSLGKKENLLLKLFANNLNSTITKEQIELTIWNEHISESALKNLLSSLRKKIGKDTIKNISGIGWKLSV